MSSRNETKTATPKRKRLWKTPAQVRSSAVGTATSTWHIDMTGPWYQELSIKLAILAAVKRGWRGYVHVDCVLLRVEEMPAWLRVIKPRGNWKCALCKQHAVPVEVAA